MSLTPTSSTETILQAMSLITGYLSRHCVDMQDLPSSFEFISHMIYFFFGRRGLNNNVRDVSTGGVWPKK